MATDRPEGPRPGLLHPGVAPAVAATTLFLAGTLVSPFGRGRVDSGVVEAVEGDPGGVQVGVLLQSGAAIAALVAASVMAATSPHRRWAGPMTAVAAVAAAAWILAVILQAAPALAGGEADFRGEFGFGELAAWRTFDRLAAMVEVLALIAAGGAMLLAALVLRTTYQSSIAPGSVLAGGAVVALCLLGTLVAEIGGPDRAGSGTTSLALSVIGIWLIATACSFEADDAT